MPTILGLRSVGRTVLAACLLLPLGRPAYASHIGDSLTIDQQTVAASDQLIDALRQYERAPRAQRDTLTQRLTQLAAARKEWMLALLERNPKLAALRVMPAALRDRLPAQAQALVERDVGLTAAIRAVVSDDLASGKSQQRLYMNDANGRAFELVVAGATARQQLSWVNKRASVTAVQFDGRLLVKDKRQVQLLAAEGSTTSTTTTTASSAESSPVQGVQKTLVVLVNFSDVALACTKDDLQSRLFGTGNGSMNDAYQQSSAGMVWFSGAVVGPFTIPYSSGGTCDLNAWASAANAAAQAAGSDPAGYARVSYALPRNPNCPFSGQATLGGQAPTPSWVMKCEMTGLFSHEIGHNLLFHHASTLTSEYGDSTDPMGGMMNVQFNAANRVMAGWVNGGRVLDVTASGSYLIDALENMGSSNPLALRMPKADTGDTYYVSLRQPIGNDTNLPLFARGAVSVHYSSGTMPAQTFQVANLSAGQTWTDSVNGLSVTHQGLTASGVSLAVTRGGAACVRTAPSVDATPLSQSAAPGNTLAYGVTVRNNNSSACPASTFDLGQILPTGFSGAFSAGSLSLAPGASASLNWSVASNSTVTDATYTLTARATETMTASASEVHTSFTVISPPPPPPPPADTSPPALSITSPANGSVFGVRGSVTLAASATDSSGVAAVDFLVDGKLIATDTSAPYTASWNLRKAGVGAHTITVRARDPFGNQAEQAITVTVAK